MSIVKSFSIGNGDMFYIDHNSDNFTIIDCCLPDDRIVAIVRELRARSAPKRISRFISTHPDEDHFRGLTYLHSQLPISNFYCVQNATTKDDETEDFQQYCFLRDSDKAFFISAGCKRKWMNQEDEVRKASGITIHWPKIDSQEFVWALEDCANGESPNNISPIIEYNSSAGNFVWMGDLETDFLENVENELALPEVSVLFAPHHGRDSGKVPQSLLAQMNPRIVVVGEAPSQHLNYYSGYNTITQNSAGDIIFDSDGEYLHVYVGSETYSVDFLVNRRMPSTHGYYIGSLQVA